MTRRKGQHEKMGQREFEHYYRAIFGPRWERLRAALPHRGAHVAYRSGLHRVYHLDAASLAAARLLPLAGARDVLDLCAAPGGKALVLASGMAPDAHLVANDRSARRRARLHRVLETHLPAATHRRVTVTGHDAARWGLYQANSADAVLADVPCSGEAHVLASPRHLARWSAARIGRLATQQHAILAAAIDTVRPGGYVLYATCALTTEENDAVVAWALDRRAGSVVLCTLAGDAIDADGHRVVAEPSACGLRILPDRSDGAGPMYAALLRKYAADA